MNSGVSVTQIPGGIPELTVYQKLATYIAFVVKFLEFFEKLKKNQYFYLPF